MPRTPRLTHLALELDRSSQAPMRTQICDAIIKELSEKRLHPHDPVPSSRSLATELGISRGSVVAAYDELVAAGFLHSTPGSGTEVAAGADLAARAGASVLHDHRSRTTLPAPDSLPSSRAVHTAPQEAPARCDARPGRPDTSIIDPGAWRRAWRTAAVREPGGNQRDRHRGHQELRDALAERLRQVRGMSVHPDELIITPGIGATLTVLPAALKLRGKVIAMEDPGYRVAVDAFRSNGIRVRGLAVDHDGLDPNHLRSSDAAVYLTPSHQYPLGARMPVARRSAVLQWAQRTGALIIEDDYDSEFRYDVAALPPLHSLPEAADRVIYLGTASKLLTPDLRVSWLIAPRPLRAAIRQELDRRVLGVNDVTGAAVGALCASGALAAHHARAARLYAARRARLVSALRARVPEFTLSGIEAGLHVVLNLPLQVPDDAVAADLAERGVLISTLSYYALERAQSGLVIGYASIDENAADTVATAIAHALAPWR